MNTFQNIRDVRVNAYGGRANDRSPMGDEYRRGVDSAIDAFVRPCVESGRLCTVPTLPGIWKRCDAFYEVTDTPKGLRLRRLFKCSGEWVDPTTIVGMWAQCVLIDGLVSPSSEAPPAENDAFLSDCRKFLAWLRTCPGSAATTRDFARRFRGWTSTYRKGIYTKLQELGALAVVKTTGSGRPSTSLVIASVASLIAAAPATSCEDGKEVTKEETEGKDRENK